MGQQHAGSLALLQMKNSEAALRVSDSQTDRRHFESSKQLFLMHMVKRVQGGGTRGCSNAAARLQQNYQALSYLDSWEWEEVGRYPGRAGMDPNQDSSWAVTRSEDMNKGCSGSESATGKMYGSGLVIASDLKKQSGRGRSDQAAEELGVRYSPWDPSLARHCQGTCQLWTQAQTVIREYVWLLQVTRFVVCSRYRILHTGQTLTKQR